MREISIEQASKDAYALAIKIRSALNENGWDEFKNVIIFSMPTATQQRAELFLDFLLEDVANTSYDMRYTCLSHSVDYTLGVINRPANNGKCSGLLSDKDETALYQKSFGAKNIIKIATQMMDSHTQLQNYAMNKHMPSKKNKL